MYFLPLVKLSEHIGIICVSYQSSMRVSCMLFPLFHVLTNLVCKEICVILSTLIHEGNLVCKAMYINMIKTHLLVDPNCFIYKQCR